MPNLPQIPLIRLLLPFVLGIITGVFTPVNLLFANCILGLFFVIYSSFLILKKINSNYNFRHLLGILIALNLIAAGHSLTVSKFSHNNIIQLDGSGNNFIVGTLISPPIIKKNIVKTTLSVEGIYSKKKWFSSKGNILISIQKDSLSKALQIGDYISFNSQLKKIPPPKNPQEFDYKKYLSYHFIHHQSYLKSNNWKKIKNGSPYNIYLIAGKIRTQFIQILEDKGIIGNELGIASALILGYKNNIDIQLKDAYSNSGVMHILAVSGLHVGILFMVFNFLLQFLEKVKYGTILKAIVLLLLLWCYALITGLSPSVLRASTMFSFIVVAKMTNRNSNFFNTLAASAFFLLIFNPYYIMEVGFQLSYIAVIGIVIIQPWLTDFYHPKYKLTNYLWSLTTVSIAAQISTFPLTLFYFHQFPNYFMAANLLVIPMAVIILYLGLSLLLTSSIPVLSDFLSFLLNKFILFLNTTVIQIDKLPYAITQNVRFNIDDVLLTYLIIILIISLLIIRKFKYLLAIQLLFILFLINNGVNYYKRSIQHKIFIYDIPKKTAINFIDGTNNILISDIDLLTEKNQLMYHVKNNWIEEGVTTPQFLDLNELNKTQFSTLLNKTAGQHLFIQQNHIQYYNTKIAILNKNSILTRYTKPLNVDILLWTSNSRLTITDVLKSYSFKQLIIDSSNSSYTAKRLQTEADSLSITYWSVANQGAYVLDL